MRVMTPASRPSKVGPAAARGETTGMSNYPPIADHGLIGDLQTAALVTTDGTVDWFCCPRFDSPSIFASLLDHRKGGHFSLHAVDDCVTKQMYLPDTAVLVTRFLSDKGVAEVMDFMPVENPGIVTDHHRLARAVRGTHGRSPRAGGRRAQLGLPLYLGPRRVLLGLRPAGAWIHRRGGGVRALAAEHDGAERGRR